jgi:hypothetical protein
MKKLALTVLLSLGLILPAIAADMDISGHFRARGYYLSKAGDQLTEYEKSDAYYDFRLRPVLKFQVNPNLYVTTRIAIFDEKYGTNDGGRYTEGTSEGQSDVAAWDRGWATWTTPYGLLDIGRMKGGVFGLSLFESELKRDRIKWTTKVGDDLTLLGIIEKTREVSDDGAYSDNDQEAYYLAGVYKTGDTEVGCLLGQKRDEYVDDANATTPEYKSSLLVVNPYFNITKDVNNRGKLSVKGEILHMSGKAEGKAAAAPDQDVSAMGFYLAAGYDFGDFDIELGYANAAGDADTSDNEISSLGGLGVVNAGLGDEWTPLVVLQDANGLLASGTTVKGTVKASTGVSLMYLQANYNVNEKIKLTGIIGMATPNEKKVNDSGVAIADSDESFGNEIDLKLSWDISDGVNYFFNLGYLMTGDFFKYGNSNAEPEDTYTIYHGIQFDL